MSSLRVYRRGLSETGFGSLTGGIQLRYTSEQLGHSNVAATARRHARWAAATAYRRPPEVQVGEVAPTWPRGPRQSRPTRIPTTRRAQGRRAPRLSTQPCAVM